MAMLCTDRVTKCLAWTPSTSRPAPSGHSIRRAACPRRTPGAFLTAARRVEILREAAGSTGGEDNEMQRRVALRNLLSTSLGSLVSYRIAPASTLAQVNPGNRGDLTMPIPRKPLVEEDLARGWGTSASHVSAGGSATGHQVNVQSLPGVPWVNAELYGAVADGVHDDA